MLLDILEESLSKHADLTLAEVKVTEARAGLGQLV